MVCARARGEPRDPNVRSSCTCTPFAALIPAMEVPHKSKSSQAHIAEVAVTVLGLESSCDETAAAIVRRSPAGTVEVLSSRIATQEKDHAPFGGVVPEIAARRHAERMDHLVELALQDAKMTYADMDGIAATCGPGLIGGVLVGMMTGKAIAMARDLPFLAINHLEGHALSPKLAAPLDFPYLLLLVSGGHTQLLEVRALGDYLRLGSTLDDAAGEAFDKTAKVLELGFPGGPAVERIARDGDPYRFSLPRPLVKRPGCDFSFAGLKTAVQRAWEGCGQEGNDKADLAASFQRAATDILVQQSAKAMTMFAETHGATTFVVAGGVAANQLIRSELQAVAQENGFAFLAPPMKFCTDNAAMIALAGCEHLARGETSTLDVAARPRWPLDEQSAKLAPVSGHGRKGPRS